MRRSGFSSLLALLFIFASDCARSTAAATDETPDFKEVYDLIRAHAAGVNEADLNRAALQGLLAALGPKVSLATNNPPATGPAATLLVNKASLFEDGIAYLRIGRVAEGLAREVELAAQRLSATNQLKGLVLDLRYATGSDYAATVATADLFVAKARPLLNWGNGLMSAQEKTNAIQLPVAILVNRETAGAAEALAAVLRATGAGLILGGRTAGQALITKGFPLKTGGELRIATTPVTLGNGAVLSTEGVKPDIDVAVSADDERSYYADAFYTVRKTNLTASVTGSLTNQPGGTNGPRRIRFNEAELVREHREGLERDPVAVEPARPRSPEPEIPMVSDPALARALDLLKGLAVVRQSRS